jgi:predicted acetyltransferase
MRLVEPSARWKAAFSEMAADYAAADEHRYARAAADFDAYLRKLERRSRGEGLPEGWIPGCELWLDDQDQLVACVRLRFGLTPELEDEGGHIGYDVRPSKRRQGYGTILLRLALIHARSLGISRVRITCDADNLGSRKIIERNGGRSPTTTTSRESGKQVLQYWIGDD